MRLRIVRFSALVVVVLVGAGSVARAVQNPGGQGNANDAPAREVTVTAFPGVIAAGAQWKLLWGSQDNADGLVGTDDGVYVAHWQGNYVSKIDLNDRATKVADKTNWVGALALDSKGRLLAAQRSCFWFGEPEDACTTPSAITVLLPERRVLVDNFNGQSLGRINEIAVGNNASIYFNSPAGLFHLYPAGKLTRIGAPDFNTNGIVLSPDEKTLYVTNGPRIVAFDVRSDGTVTNQREFGKLQAGGGGDGMAVDADGRLYVTSPPGIQVLGPDGKYLGLIPTPRAGISVAFGGPDKRTLYFVGAGAVGPDGRALLTPPGVRNNARSVYKITTIAQGFRGRAK